MFNCLARAMIALYITLFSINSYSQVDSNYIFHNPNNSNESCVSISSQLDSTSILGADAVCAGDHGYYSCPLPAFGPLSAFIQLGFSSCPATRFNFETSIRTATNFASTPNIIIDCTSASIDSYPLPNNYIFTNHPSHSFILASTNFDDNVNRCLEIRGQASIVPDCEHIDDFIGDTCILTADTICSDGFANSVGFEFGYNNCDRPSLTLCDNGEHLIGDCPVTFADTSDSTPTPMPTPISNPDVSTPVDDTTLDDLEPSSYAYNRLSHQQLDTAILTNTQALCGAVVSPSCLQSLANLIASYSSSRASDLNYIYNSVDSIINDIQSIDNPEILDKLNDILSQQSQFSTFFDDLNASINNLDISPQFDVDTSNFDNSVASINSKLTDITSALNTSTNADFTLNQYQFQSDIDNATEELNTLISTVKSEFSDLMELNLTTNSECIPINMNIFGNDFDVAPCRYFEHLTIIPPMVILSSLITSFFIIFSGRL